MCIKGVLTLYYSIIDEQVKLELIQIKPDYDGN